MEEEIPLSQQRYAVLREIEMRRRVYPGWIAKGRMSQAKADKEIAAMEAVLKTLDALFTLERE